MALGLGCALYFGLPREPQNLVAWGLLPFVAGLLIATRWSAWRVLTVVLVLSACGLGGFAVAKLRTESVKGAVALAGARPQWVEAWVVDVASPGQGGQRLLLAPVSIGDWSPAATPVRIRVTLRRPDDHDDDAQDEARDAAQDEAQDEVQAEAAPASGAPAETAEQGGTPAMGESPA